MESLTERLARQYESTDANRRSSRSQRIIDCLVARQVLTVVFHESDVEQEYPILSFTEEARKIWHEMQSDRRESDRPPVEGVTAAGLDR